MKYSIIILDKKKNTVVKGEALSVSYEKKNNNVQVIDEALDVTDFHDVELVGGIVDNSCASFTCRRKTNEKRG
jgi:hypothetical protein